MAFAQTKGVKQDIAVIAVGGGCYDIAIADDGDLLATSGMGTSLHVLLLADRRADESQVLFPQNRRGFIGDLVARVEGRELGSHLWLYENQKNVAEVRAQIQAVAVDAYQPLIEDGAIQSVEAVVESIGYSGVTLSIKIGLNDGQTDTKYYRLWQNTEAS